MNTNATNTDKYLASLPAWQQANLELFRTLVNKALPNVEEQIKWGVPVFINGKTTLFAMSAFKSHTKYNFIYNGALIDDKDGLFNNGLESKKSRGIDMSEGDVIDESSLTQLIRRAIAAV